MPVPFISTVSCAGPDDQSDPAEIVAMASACPEMEIGLQMSLKRQGSAAYPTLGWLLRFAEAAARSADAGRPIRAALHANGSWCRDLCSGIVPMQIAELIGARTEDDFLFQRIQLNFGAQRDAICSGRLTEAMLSLRRPVILQSHAENTDLLRDLCAASVQFDVLFDGSGGVGQRPSCWPDPIGGHYNAWAGGLGPDTVGADIPALAEKARSMLTFGIDAQRNLRTAGDDQFSVARASEFAAAAQRWNASAHLRT